MDKGTEHLIKGCRKGNRNAQSRLYELYVRPLYSACLRIIGNAPEAEEATQDAFMKIFSRIEQYEGECFEAWARRIAIHTAIDYVRRRTGELVIPSDNLPEPDEEEEEPDEEAIHYSVERIKKAISTLAAGYRVILSLYLFEGYDMEEIASILKIQPASVRSQYLRAKRKLLTMITQ